MPSGNNRKLTDSDRAYIQAHYQPRSIERLARELQLPIKAVTKVVRELGIGAEVTFWTEEQKQYLRDHYGLLSYEEMARQLGKTVLQLRAQRGVLRLPSMRSVWTPERLRFLQEEGPKYSYSQIAKKIGIAKHLVTRMGGVLKVPRPRPPYYSEQEKQFIIDHYATMSAESIGKHLNRPKSGIMHQASRLGIHKTAEEFSRFQLTVDSLSDRYIAKHMARQQPDLQQKLLEYPELLAVRKQEIVLNRLIKHASKQT